MRFLKNQGGQVLVILLTTVFLGGSTAAVGVLTTGQTSKEITKKVKKLDMDKDREKQALKLVKRWKKDGKAFWKADQKNLKKVFKLMKKYETTPEDLDRFLARQDRNIDKNDAILLDSRFALKEVLTEEEWNAVFN